MTITMFTLAQRYIGIQEIAGTVCPEKAHGHQSDDLRHSTHALAVVTDSTNDTSAVCAMPWVLA